MTDFANPTKHILWAIGSQSFHLPWQSPERDDGGHSECVERFGSNCISFPLMLEDPVSPLPYRNFWATSYAPLREDVLADIPRAPYRGVLEVVDDYWFLLGSRRAERRSITLIGRHSQTTCDEQTFVAEVQRRLALFSEFEVAVITNGAVPRLGPTSPCGRKPHRFPPPDWPFNHVHGQLNYGQFLITVPEMLSAAVNIVREVMRPGTQVDIHDLTPSFLTIFSDAGPPPPSPFPFPQLPDDVIVHILSFFVNPTTPLSPLQNLGPKLVNRQFYRCWWKAALGSSSPSSLWFGRRIGGYAANCSTRSASVDMKDVEPIWALDNLTLPFDQRPAVYSYQERSNPVKRSVLNKISHKLKGTRAATTATATAPSSPPPAPIISDPFTYTVIDSFKIVSLDLTGQYAHQHIRMLLRERFVNVEHLVWNRSMGLTDEMLALIVTGMPKLRKLSIAWAGTKLGFAQTASALGSRIEELNIAGCSFLDVGLLQLGRICTGIRRLDISRWSTAPRYEIFNMLGTKPPDNTLQLCGDVFPSLEVLLAPGVFNGAIPFCRFLTFGERAAAQLKALDLSVASNYAVPVPGQFSALQSLTSLEVLHLNGYAFAHGSLNADLKPLVMSLPRLRYLGLSSPIIGEPFAEFFAHALNASPSHFAPLTIMQLPYDTGSHGKSNFLARHVVWPTALCMDDIVRLAGSRVASAGSHSAKMSTSATIAQIRRFLNNPIEFSQSGTRTTLRGAVSSSFRYGDYLG